MKNKIAIVSHTMKEVREDCILWAEEISESFRPDIVVFIAKSGFLFAEPIAEYFGCNMMDITVKRPGDKVKDSIKKIFHHIPKFLWFALIRLGFGYNDKHSDRVLTYGRKFLPDDLAKYKNILLVDDSADTGFTVIKAEHEIQRLAPESQIKVCCYCVLSMCEKRVRIDYSRYKDTVIFTGTSRYSDEYSEFVRRLEEWEES